MKFMVSFSWGEKVDGHPRERTYEGTHRVARSVALARGTDEPALSSAVRNVFGARRHVAQVGSQILVLRRPRRGRVQPMVMIGLVPGMFLRKAEEAEVQNMSDGRTIYR